jgi:signal peptidase II
MNLKRAIIFGSVFGVALIADQLLKLEILRQLSAVGELFFLRIIKIRFFANTGVAFGIPLGGWWLVVFLVLVFLVLLYLYMKYLRSDKLVAVVALALVLGGAVGNIIDRIRLGYVVDYVAISILPVFNLADVFIIAGILIMVWRILLLDEKPPLRNPLL